eukprot:2079452-Amphidinium_carterae.1
MQNAHCRINPLASIVLPSFSCQAIAQDDWLCIFLELAGNQSRDFLPPRLAPSRETANWFRGLRTLL